MTVFTTGTRVRRQDGSWDTQDVRPMTEEEIKSLTKSLSGLPAAFSKIKTTNETVGRDAIEASSGLLDFFTEVRIKKEFQKLAEDLVGESLASLLNEVPTSAVVWWTIPLEVDISSDERDLVRVAAYARGYRVEAA